MTDAKLTADEIARYQDQGYLIPKFRLDPAHVQDLQDSLNRLIADNPGVRPEKLVSAHIEGDNGFGRRRYEIFNQDKDASLNRALDIMLRCQIRTRLRYNIR